MNYSQTVSYLNSLNPLGIELGLGRMRALLEKLHFPERNYSSILIAGTNGKGSTATILASLLQEAGEKTGLYTSPHMVDFRERIKVDGEQISPEELTDLVERVRSLVEEEEFSYFEFTTALALLYFADKEVSRAVLEVGLGGRLDATNVVNPDLSVITEIGFDHQEFLGDDIPSITREKGGIIRSLGRVVISTENREAGQTLLSLCREKGAACSFLGKDYRAVNRRVAEGKQCFDFESSRGNYTDLEIPLLGKHQIQNTATAIETLLALYEEENPIVEKNLRRGLSSLKIEGRNEWVHGEPPILLDGAHNPQSADLLATILREELSYKKLYLLLGVMAEKDYRRILEPLAPLASTLFLCRPHTPRAADPALLREEAITFCKEVRVVEEVEEALAQALELGGEEDLLCVAGSFYTVGEAKNYLKRAVGEGNA